MTFIDLALGRRALTVLVVLALVASVGCSGTTEPLQAVDVSGAWAGSVSSIHTLEVTLAQSPSAVITGSGIRRLITPDPSRARALDTVASAIRIEGSVLSGQIEMEIIDVDASAFSSLKTIAYRFKGTVGSKTMSGTLSIVQGSELDFGPPHSPIPPESISFTWVRAQE